MLTLYDQEREGRVVELTLFFPGDSGYEMESPDNVQSLARAGLVGKEKPE